MVPWGVTGSSASIVVDVGYDDDRDRSRHRIVATSPGLYTFGGQALVYNQDGTINSSSNAAAAGSVVVLYATGLGQTNPQGQDGVQKRLC